MGKTLFDKIWDQHIIQDLGDGWALLHVDRHLLHDLSGPMAFKAIVERGLEVPNPELAFATPDHAVSSAPGRTAATFPTGQRFYDAMVEQTRARGIRLFDLGARGQGIVHVTGPELGLVLPGATVVCADSHTCTNGGLGALAFGVGTSECIHALATQTLRLRKPRTMRVRLDGEPGKGVSPKDIILHVIRLLGTDGGVEHAIEFAGDAIEAMSIEGRLTVCNLTVEMGARSGLVAPDEKTIDFLRGKPFAPQGDTFEVAAAAWRLLASDRDAVFDRDVAIDVSQVSPTITWGTSPGQSIDVDGIVPDPASEPDPIRREQMIEALDYMGIEGGQPIAGTSVDYVFIGSCANSRLPDLRAAAEIVCGRRVVEGVTAWVVPGSVAVKRAAEAEGLDRIFRDAGFEWREPGCSMCVAANGEIVPPGKRAVSTSNRNFVGRQGPRARTHLASPAMAAAAAITGIITDVRRI